MQDLEKTLEKLGAYICDELCCHRDVEADQGDDAMQEICEKCDLGGYLDEIRKCLSGENNTEITRFSRDSDWIPVSERLPEVGEYVLGTNEYDEVMIYRYGWNSRHSRKMFFHECGAAAIITAWMPLPEPYRPKSKTPEEMQEWKERMLQNFMKKGAM